MRKFTLCIILLVACVAVPAQEAPPPEAAPPPVEAVPAEAAPAPVIPQLPPLTQPLQVVVSAKIVEFQANKGVETGLSAYFARSNKVDWWGIVHTPTAGIMTADVTFPAGSGAGITVFLDRIAMTDGDLEVVLQALVDENKATILSQPKVMVKVGPNEKTKITTSQRIPYENTKVVGSTAVQTTDFRQTGVTLEIGVPNIYDLDGNWATTDDTLIELVIYADVSEEGQRLVIALDDQLAPGNNFAEGRNAITAPEFIARNISTQLYVRNGQVLVMGGLFQNSRSKNITSVPWLSQSEDFVLGMAERVVPGEYLWSPFSSIFGNRRTRAARRELVFLIKAEAWRPAFTVADDHGFIDAGAMGERARPSDIITGVIGGITEIPQDIGEGIKRRTTPQDQIESELGGRR
jgi:hypothetical protein